MIKYEPRFRAFAMCLSALAGFVDAAGFVLTGGLFVSFMSGNSTRLAVAFSAGSSLTFLAGSLIALFFSGVVAGALLAPWKRARRKSVVLTFSTTLLMLSAGLVTWGDPVAGAMCLAVAMGSLNNVFLREGEVSIGVTYMTGTLVRAGQRLAGALRREEPSDWLSYLLLWASLVCGATAGAAVAASNPALSVSVAAAFAVVMTLLAHRMETQRLL